MGIHIHNHNHYPEYGEIKHLLHTIIQKLNSMPSKAEWSAAFEEIKASFATQGNSLANISDDITRLTDGLEGGDLTAEEEADAFSQLRAIATQAKVLSDNATALADRTPDPTTPVPPTE